MRNRKDNRMKTGTRLIRLTAILLSAFLVAVIFSACAPAPAGIRGGDAFNSGASPFYPKAWFRLDGDSGNPIGTELSAESEPGNTPCIQFHSGDNYAVKIPYKQNQHFTFMLYVSDRSGEPVGMKFRLSDNTLPSESYYYIGTNGSSVVFGKNVNEAKDCFAIADEAFAAAQWIRVDVVFADAENQTDIEVYLNQEKLEFTKNENAVAPGLLIKDGKIRDIPAAIQSGDYFGVCHNGGADAFVRLAPYTGEDAAKEILLKDAYHDVFPVGVALTTGNAAHYKDAGLTRHFNSLTAEYHMKWGRVQPAEGQFFFADSDKLITFSKDNGMKVRGHALVWYKSIPSWIFADIPETPDPAAKTKLLGRIANHVEAVVEHFDETVYVWDVVNEALLNSPSAAAVDSGIFYRTGAAETTNIGGYDWYKYCGSDYIDEAFYAADRARSRAGLSNLKLFYNDYSLMFGSKRNAAVKMLQGMLDRGVPIDGIGMQSHFRYDSFSAVEFEKSVKAFTDLGLEVQLTELDISLYSSSESSKTSLSAQELAERSVIQQKAFEDIFRIARKYAVPQVQGGGTVTGVTFWGVADDASWLSSGRRDHPLLFDRSFAPKSGFPQIIHV